MGERLVVQSLRCILDFHARFFLHHRKVEMYGCWGNRDVCEAPHYYAFQKRSDLNAAELAQVQLR